MTKSDLRIAKMNKEIRLIACLGVLLATTGCYMFRPLNYNYEKEETVAETVMTTCPDDGTPCVVPPAAPQEYVDYTRTAADYREYGERTPRDQRIVQTAPGSNMSAAIPPTIDEEVGAYEEEIKSTGSAEFTENAGTDSAGSDDDDDPVKDWLAEEGQSLKALLTEWSDESGWRLIWNSNRNYTLSAGAMFRGRFADVSAALIRAFGRASPAPVATFYKGNRVLVVETMEDENAFD